MYYEMEVMHNKKREKRKKIENPISVFEKVVF